MKLLKKFQWYVRRLSVMPPAEIPHRARQALVKLLLRRGWSPWPEVHSLSPLPDFGFRGILSPSPSNPSQPEDGLWRTILHQAEHNPGTHALLGLPPRDLGQPPQWSLDPATGQSWPPSQSALAIDYRHQSHLGEVKYVWEVARMPWLLPRALAAQALGHPPLAQLVLRDILDFVHHHPPLVGIHWTSGIESAWRAVTWCLALDLIRDLAEPTPEQLGRIATHLGAGAELCLQLESRYSSANNHLIAEGACLETVARFFPTLDRSSVWLAAGKRILDAEVPRQILPDGSGGEYCPAYLLEVLEWALVVARLRHHAGDPIPPSWIDRFGQSAHYLAALCAPGEPLPPLGDSDDANLFPLPGEDFSHRVQHLIHVLRSWSGCDSASGGGALGKLLANPAIVNHHSPIREPCPELLAPTEPRSPAPGETMGHQGRQFPDSEGSPHQTLSPEGPVLPRVDVFPQAGHAVLRHGHLRTVLECGPHGLPPLYAHAHSDAGSLLVDWNGQPVLVDPGTFCYHGERVWRDWFRSAAAHNLLQIDGREQARLLGPFMWDQAPDHTGVEQLPTNDGTVTARAIHSAYAPWNVERRVILLPSGTLLIEDHLLASSPVPPPTPHASLRWQFASGSLEVNETSSEARWTSPSGLQAKLEWRWAPPDADPINAFEQPQVPCSGEWKCWLVQVDVVQPSPAPA
jgi:hypothetical protein